MKPSWQERRVRFAEIVEGVRAGSLVAQAELDQVLAEFEAQNPARTPIENLDILGICYVQAEGVERTLAPIAFNAMLGWYDVLRFASESGREEIAQGFFKLPFVLAGTQASAQAAQFFDEQPEKTAELVAHGIELARMKRGMPGHEERWPVAYGLEAALYVQTGSAESIAALAKGEWDQAWIAAEQRVRAYYRGSE